MLQTSATGSEHPSLKAHIVRKNVNATQHLAQYRKLSLEVIVVCHFRLAPNETVAQRRSSFFTFNFNINVKVKRVKNA